MLDLSGMRSVAVDAAARMARVVIEYHAVACHFPS